MSDEQVESTELFEFIDKLNLLQAYMKTSLHLLVINLTNELRGHIIIRDNVIVSDGEDNKYCITSQDCSLTFGNMDRFENCKKSEKITTNESEEQTGKIISESIKTELTIANKNKEPDKLNTEMDSTSNNNEKITEIHMGNVILKDNLREKDELVAKLQQKLEELNNNYNRDKKLLITMRKENKILSTNYNTCNKSLQLSQKRIE